MTAAIVPAPRGGVDDYNCSTAAEFLDVLSPRHAGWSGAAPAWIYRGQANADWWLQPAAVRDAKAFERYGVNTDPPPGYDPSVTPAWSSRATHLERMLLRFREGLSRSGLAVPSRAPRIAWRETSEMHSGNEPIPEAFPLMALAQHHGLPTLLLDWSRRAWVGAYFAAADAAENASRLAATHLAVWGVLREHGMDEREGLRFYEPPGDTNPNLHAQAGLFTLYFAEDDPPLEEHLVRIRAATGAALPLRRIMLPITQAAQLLRLLFEEGIHGAAMFPGADGVVRSMREHALWR